MINNKILSIFNTHASAIPPVPRYINVLEKFYAAIRDNKLDKLHIPHSDVYYVRAAVEAHYGRTFTLKHVETAMKAEGWKDS
jgi:hypothetical protein